jgi:hypothetical protein
MQTSLHTRVINQNCLIYTPFLNCKDFFHSLRVSYQSLLALLDFISIPRTSGSCSAKANFNRRIRCMCSNSRICTFGRHFTLLAYLTILFSRTSRSPKSKYAVYCFGLSGIASPHPTSAPHGAPARPQCHRLDIRDVSQLPSPKTRECHLRSTPRLLLPSLAFGGVLHLQRWSGVLGMNIVTGSDMSADHLCSSMWRTVIRGMRTFRGCIQAKTMTSATSAASIIREIAQTRPCGPVQRRIQSSCRPDKECKP